MKQNTNTTTWADLNNSAMQAVNNSIELAIKTASNSIEITSVGYSWNEDKSEISLKTIASSATVDWENAKFFLTKKEVDHTKPENRYILKSGSYDNKNNKLTLTLDKTVQKAFQHVESVKVFLINNIEIMLKSNLKTGLEQSAEGNVLATIWGEENKNLQTWNPTHLKERPLNKGQQTALAAMCSPGGYLVWGPPGTGKTTVITSAVQHALKNHKSVLIASHTNIAVDNVLESLVKDNETYKLGIVTPGNIVRHLPGTQEAASKLLESVRKHEFLRADKAAAWLKLNDKEFAAIEEKIKTNNAHVFRDQIQYLLDELTHKKIMVEEVNYLREISFKIEKHEQLQQKFYSMLLDLGQVRKNLSTQNVALQQLSDVNKELELANRNYNQALDTCQSLHRENTDLIEKNQIVELEIISADAKLSLAISALETKWVKIFPWISKKRNKNYHKYVAAKADFLKAKQQLVKQLSDNENVYNDAQQKMFSFIAKIDQAQAHVAQRKTILAKHVSCKKEETQIIEKLNIYNKKIDKLKVFLDKIPEANEKIAQAKQNGVFEVIDIYQEIIVKVEDLDYALTKLENAKKELEDKYTQAHLLREAAVVACTLASLSSNLTLRNRSFDVVIIDEVASANAANVVFAGSKAKETLALVGDFLQNAPIANSEEAITAEQKKIVAWQKRDIFALAGITSRVSAQEHPRCVAITKQYRYPAVIADIVNDFCYDGMLESHKISKEAAGNIVNFVDTSKLKISLRKEKSSWKCKETTYVALEVATNCLQKNSNYSLGYVSPYLAQATEMGKVFKQKNMKIEAGTSYRFQGREFDVVIFDLMQHGTETWVSLADLNDFSERGVSAAKLLNVALTRAKKQIFLIGNWDLIKKSNKPGMQALANLADHPNFVLSDANKNSYRNI